MKFKDKTRGGFAVEIFATDLSGRYPVGGIITEESGGRQLASWGTDGRLQQNLNDPRDLIPIPDYSEFKKGDLCWVWDDDPATWRVGIFSCVGKDGRPRVVDGCGKFGDIGWLHCEKVFQPLSGVIICKLGADSKGDFVTFAHLIEKEIMKQVEK